MLLASFHTLVPAVLRLIVPHNALVSRLTSPRLIPNGGCPLPTPCALIAIEKSVILVFLGNVFCYHPVQDISSLVRSIQSTRLCILF